MEFQKITEAEAKTLASQLLASLESLTMATVGKNGEPNVRCMAVGAMDGIDTLWFSTSAQSEKVAELKANPMSALYGFHPEQMSEVRLYGTVELLTDRKSRERVWKEEYKQYWPEGIASPDMMVMKFTVKRGHYSGNGMTGSF